MMPRARDWQAEEAWRSNPNAQRFEALLALRDLAEHDPAALAARLALPPRPRRPRPGVWATDDGLAFAEIWPCAEQYGDTYTEVDAGGEHVFHRVDAARWAHLRAILPDDRAGNIRAALVDLFGAEAIQRTECDHPITSEAA